MNARIAAVIAVVLLAAPAASQAAERYATPSPDLPADCSQADPCSLQTAVEAAANGDEVIVGEGTYDEGTNQLKPTVSDIEIHGAANQVRPKIVFGAMGNVPGLLTNLSGPTDLRRLEIEYGGTASALQIINSTGTAEQLLVKTATGYGCEFEAPAYTLRDSVCATSADGRLGLLVINFTNQSWMLTLRNVTTVASGNSGTAIYASTSDVSATTVDAKNVIAQGGSGGTSADIKTFNSGDPGASSNVTLSHSSYDSECEVTSPPACGPGSAGTAITDPGSGTNQLTAPIFADADFHQAADSPTIDAGTSDPANGAGDLDGDQRSLGAAPDIGADEFVPPTPPSPPADPQPTAEPQPTQPQPDAEPQPEPGDQPRDTDPPETSITKTKVKGDVAIVRFRSDEAGSTFECRVDRKRFKPCTSPRKVRNLDEGKHRFAVRATDSAGNSDPTLAKAKFEVGS